MIVVLVVLVLGGLFAARNRRQQRPRRDWLTVAGLFTWRPARRWAAITVPAAVMLVANRVWPGVGLIAGVGLLAGAWALWPDLPARARRHVAERGAADALVRAMVEARCLGTERWLRCPHPLPKRTALTERGVVEHTVRLPPGMDLDGFAAFGPVLAATLDTAAVDVAPHPTRPSGWCVVRVAASPVTARRPLAVVSAPDAERLIQLGDGLHGPVCWDLDEEVGLAVYGAPGAGKGRLARYVALQWLDDRYGRELVVIDLQGSAEWAPLRSHPRCKVLQFDPRQPVDSLAAIVAEVEAVAVAGADRMDVCASYGVDNWRDLPLQARALYPRRAVIFDEISNGLGKPATGDKSETAALVKTLGLAIGKAYRTLRKTGVQCIHLDQLTYADTTTLPPGSTAMFGRWVALGGFGPDAREQISGTRDWPDRRAQAGLGVTGRRGAAQIDVVGVPDVSRRAVVDTLDLAALPVTSAAANHDG